MNNTENLSPEVKSLIEKLEILKNYLKESNYEEKSRTKYKWNADKQRHEIDKGFNKTGTGLHGAFIAIQSVENKIYGTKPFGVKHKKR